MTRRRGLLTRLHKWARRQDENFTTEVFAYLLEDLSHSHPEECKRLLVNLTGNSGWMTEEAEDIKFKTQNTQDEGRPDLTIEGRDNVASLEAKVKQKPDLEQLRRHNRYLRSEMARGRLPSLVLLTRDADDSWREHVDEARHWYDVADWIERLPVSVDPVAQQFLQFLREQAMAIQKVDESLIDGVRSLMSFGLMLREAMRTAGFGAIAWATNTEAYGFSAGADGLRFWVSVPFEEPDVLRVQATPIDRVKAEALEEGNRPSAVSEAYWHFTHNLSELGFFALEAQAQSEFLKDKLRQDLEAFRSIRKAPTV